jgi:hypothetical protein
MKALILQMGRGTASSFTNDCAVTNFPPFVLTTPDHNLDQAVAAIIKHDSLTFMSNLLLFIREHSRLRGHVSLIAFLFSALECDFEILDFFDVAESALEILSATSPMNEKEIDSAFEMLGRSSPSFSVIVTEPEEGTLRLALENQARTISHAVVLPFQGYVSHPSHFLLSLPLRLLSVRESDGVLHVRAKFRTLARLVKGARTDQATMAEILQMFADFLIVTYNEMTSVCMDGLSACIASFLQRYQIGPTIALIQRLLFVRAHSWYHSATILRVVKGIPIDLA